MMLHESKTYEEPSMTHVIEGVLSKLEPQGTMLVEAGKEVAQEGAVEVPKTFH